MRQLICLLCLPMVMLAGCGQELTADLAKLPAPVNVVTGTSTLAVGDPPAAAGDALGRIGEKAVPALVEALKDPDPMVRVRACKALGYMGPSGREAVPNLTAALADSVDAVREQAARALGQIGEASAPAVPELLRLMREKRDGGQ
jgi:hypothetical protein